MKIAALLLCALGLLLAQERDGNFNIRFEPSAKLQTGVEVPFQITVTDAIHKPLPHAKVTLQIELADHTQTKVFPAPETQPGIYVAKPIFPVSGEWTVYVEVRRDDQMSNRAIQFTVAE